MRMSMTKNKSSVEFEVVAHQYEREREYWLTNLSGELVKSGIAYDHKESPGKRNEAEVRFQLPGNVSSKLIKLSSGVDEVLHMALTAAVVLLLNKYTGNSDIIVGTPIYKEDVKREFINTVLALRNQLEADMTFKDLLLQVKQTILNAIEHQNYPIEIVLEQLKLPVSTEDFPLFEITVLLGNIHDESYITYIHLPMIFFFMRSRANNSNDIDIVIEGSVKYDPTLYGQETIEKVVNHFILLLETVLSHTDMPLSAVEILSEEEKKQLLYSFNNTETAYPRGKTIPQLFEEQVEKIPDNIALRYEDQCITYKELDEKSNQLANYLCFEKAVRINEPVGLLMDRSLDMIGSILGILKAGGAYVPIDSSFPEERMKIMINDAGIGVFISQKRYIKTLNRLQWECTGFHTYLCLDSEDIYAEEEVEKSELMGKKLWEYVGETATDEITGGGWLSSYTGEPIPAEEMAEYGDNILKKLTPLLHPEMRILEIGCASGISMYRIAPKVGLYYGTDLSSVIIRKNQERIRAGEHQNIVLSCAPAHEIDTIPENNFDLVIINSVIQCFHGHNYLRKVIHKAIDKLGDNGCLFIGDVMNQDLKAALIQDLVSFKKAHSRSEGKEKDYKTKTDWSTELFVSPAFFEDLMLDIPEIRSVEFSDKIYTIENELTKYRYDAFIFIDKDKNEPVSSHSFTRHKYQHDVRTLRKYSAVPVNPGLKPGGLAYIIYTSGSTGRPKGTLTTHFNVIRVVKDTNYIDLKASDQLLQLSNYAFDGSVFDIFGALLNGSRLVMMNHQDVFAIDRLAAIIQREKISVFFVTTALFNTLLDIEIECFKGVKKVLFGGEKVSLEHAVKALEHSGRDKFIHVYGPTETTVYASYYFINRIKEGQLTIPIGKPLSNTTLYVLDRWVNPVPIGVAGELFIGGDGGAVGYLNNPPLTHEKFMNNPFVEGDRLYRTGDLVRWLSSGNIEFIGRMDNQVKIRGFRIELEEIENRLLEHPDIKDTAVVVRDDGSGDNFLCAYIVPRSSAAPDDSETFSLSELASYLEKELPDFMIPSHFVELPGLPLTINGKIDRKALPEPDAVVPEDYVGPVNPIQEQLTTIWSEVLNIEKNRISIDSNFFEIGGHSLKATVLMSKIHKEMNVKVQLAEIFKFPTIRQLAAHVESINQTHEHEQKRFISIEPVEKREYYDLSPAQKRLYILQQMEAVYNMTAAWELKGVLNRRQLEETVNQLTQRHESLRTSFGMVNDVPFQKIHDRVDFKVEYYDLSKVEVEVKAEEGKSIPHAYASCSMLPAGILESFIRPFDLTQVPLMRVGLIKIKEEHHILVLDMHHIISDGTSLGIFIKEFMDVYSSRVFPALRLQYKDYSRWHKSECEGEVIKKQEDYWMQQFDTEIPILNLPYDYPRPAVQSYEGGTLNFQLGKEEMEALKGFAAGEDAVATMYMVLLALFNVLLAKLSGNHDITVGTPIAGRRHIDLQPIIGMFVGTLALRNYPDPSRTFFTFLQEVKERTLTAFENQDYQFEDLVEHVVVNRDPSRNPLFDVMFALQNMEVQEMEISGLKVGLYDFENKIANFDLFLQGFEKEDGVIFLFTYCTKLFKKETVERFVSYFKMIMSVLIKNPHKKISEIEIISAEEKQQILVDFNNTWRDYPQDKTIHQLFEEQVEKTGDRVAIIGMGHGAWSMGGTGPIEQFHAPCSMLHVITYRELNQKSNELAFLLRDRGVKPGTIVGIMVEHSMEMEIGVMGILKAGGAYLPIDPDYPEERIRYMLTDSGAQILLTSSDNIPVGTGNQGGLAPLYLPIEDRLTANSEKQPATNPENLAYIIYTSGSTGNPKGVVVEHGSAVNVLSALFNRYPITETDVYLLKTSFVFDVSVTELFGWFWGGGRMVILGRGEHKDPTAIINAIETSTVTHINFVPAMFNAFVDTLNAENIRKLASLKYIFLAGEALVPELVNKFRRLGINVPLENLYGPTEGTVYASGYSLDQWDGSGNIPIGSPLQNMALCILGMENHLQPVGICGELCIAGGGVARGYLNNPDFTAERFDPDFQDDQEEKGIDKNPLTSLPLYPSTPLYRTGDCCRWLPDGNIEFFGRIDRQIKIRGFRVELGEIENRLLTHESVKEAVVLDREDKNGDKYLCAYIVTLDGDRDVDADVTAFEKMPKTRNTELKEYLSQTLPGYMIPSFFVLMDRIPLTPSGKVNRRTLPEPEVEFNVEYAAPQNHIEKKLAEIWADILEIDKSDISIDASFFDLGGHSLKATIMISRIKKILNATIPLAKVFKTPSIREIAKHVAPVDKAQCFSIEAVEEREFYPLSPMQNRFFILNQLQTLKTAYNLPSVLTMEGKLNRKKFEKAFQQLIRRHESLRTSFMLIDDEPRQRIQKEAAFKIEYYEVIKDQVEIEEYVTNFVKPFDLSQAPLLRVELIKVEEEKHILMFDMHHIISDGTSLGILIKDIVRLYDMEALPPLPLQYKDYSQWLFSPEGRETIAQQEAYWLDQFNSPLPVLNMYTDYPRPPIQSFKGDTIHFFMGKELSQKIRRLIAQTGATLYMVLLAALNILLSRYSGQEDIVVGTPIAGRENADFEDVIALFINALPIRNYPRKYKTFTKFLAEVKKNTINAYENQGYPFETLMEKLKVEKDLSRNPLFDVELVVLNMETPALEAEGLTFTPYRHESEVSQVDIAFYILEFEEEIRVNLMYSTDLFKRETMEGFIAFFRDILSTVADNQEIKLEEIKMSHDLAAAGETVILDDGDDFGF